MTDIQMEFLRDRVRAQIGQKVDATPSTIVSSTAATEIPFGALVIYDNDDAFLCKMPTTKEEVVKPLGITLRQHHCQKYEPKNSIAVLRKGRVWIKADKVKAPGDPVYIAFATNGVVTFSGDAADNVPLKNAIFLEKSEGGLTPIEVNFFGGVS